MKTNISETKFYQFLRNNIDKGKFSNDDLLSTILPLLKDVAEIHSQDLVAELDDLANLEIIENHLRLKQLGKKAKFNHQSLQNFFPKTNNAFEVTEEYSQKIIIGDTITIDNENIESLNEAIKPIHLVNYQSYEVKLNHHDPITDIYILGTIMASVAFGLDLTDEDEISKFTTYRDRLTLLNPKISSSICSIIYGMTDLNRKKRWSDINEVIEKFKNYRDYNPEKEQDLGILIEPKIKNRNQFIQEKLRNRLFDSSRRNRLLYYQPNLRFLNLSIASVPQVLDYNNIREESLFYWNADLSKKIINGTSISLDKYLQTSENTYIIPTLDKIRLEANKDINEYGFSQLKLVLSFLNWYNTKENSNEKIVTPLLLASVNLVKKKGLKDQYTLEFTDSDVEVNPVLANVLKELYNIQLPEVIQLTETSIEDLYNLINHQVSINNSGITLDLIKKPRIKLIHTQAVQMLGQYVKRTNKKTAIQDKRNLSYSYNAQDFQPLGLEMFKNYVNFNVSSLEFLINKDITLSSSQFAETKVIDREFFQLDEGNINPFKWEFDTSNLVLGNFNYKKMSLVRDYNAVIDAKLESNVFNKLFNALSQKEFESKISNENTFTDNFNVVASDATQNKAVKYSENKESYIIQGPPGTGKSQTIANLIANFVANDKKVLFVCEKRAALDVVFHRLSNQNLDEICCLIHDSQADKKEFILNLKKTFNDFSSSNNDFDEIENTRNQVVQRINLEIETLKDFHGFMNKTIKDSDFSLHQIFDVLISNKNERPQNIDTILNNQVGFGDWINFETVFVHLSIANKDTNQSEYFSEHPFKHLKGHALSDSSSAQELQKNIKQLQDKIENFNEQIDLFDMPANVAQIKHLKVFFENCNKVLFFYLNGNEKLLDANTGNLNELKSNLNRQNEIKSQLKDLEKQYPYWQQKLSETDTKSALEIALKNENSLLSLLNTAFRQVKNAVNSAYDFNAHTIKPKYSDVLSNLMDQYELQNDVNNLQKKLFADYKTNDLNDLIAKVEEIKNSNFDTIFSFIESLSPQEKSDFIHIYELYNEIRSLLDLCIEEYQDYTLTDLEKIIQKITSKQQYFSLYGTIFADFKTIDNSIFTILRNHKISNYTLQNILAQNSLESYFAENYGHKKYNMDILNAAIRKIKKNYKELLSLNGKYIVSKQRDNFKKLIFKSNQSGASADKTLKRTILEGRKILENEFNKTIRFKSIRELATSEAGQIIRETKPVWLMSPLSVSDTLPMDENYFDVVIFDEASQITLEEGLPPIYRAKQTIIVGDEMQMPPSNFFGSSSGNSDDLWQTEEDDNNEYFSLDADSFLTQGARKFPSIMLGWHYRSRHEALIGFSNASFYDNKLLTIPDVKDHQKKSEDIVVEDCQSAKLQFVEVYQKPISYHYIKKGVYTGRSNVQEASYIAQLVKELLFDNKGLSIGIVAFSMEQQSVIENAIEEICKEDKKFENLIEEEYKRTEDNQFVGLFVKNLENVQGDERDIIIMSTCYGYDTKGKMLMNFGPINKRGGEKRLNVIFSRAKKSMVVVSSIKYFDIKNEYNEGANYFRKYLQYAELISLGQLENANNVLNAINDSNKSHFKSSVTLEIQTELVKLGYIVNVNIGQSKFKCNLAIKKNDFETDYILGIVIDDVNHYANQDVLEQYLFKPEILKTNGWKMCQIYAKDWYENKARVLQFIISSLQNESNEDSIVEEEVEEILIIEPLESKIETKETEVEALPTPEVKNQTENTPINLPTKDAKLERFIFTEDGSNKFWEVGVQNGILIVLYGRIGTKGQKLIKEFDTEELAIVNMKKLISQKTAKGYRKD